MIKLKRKYNRYRSLKTISYLLGFPLLIVFALIESGVFKDAPGFGKTWYYGVGLILALWLVMSVLQGIFAIICKNKNGRAMFALVLVVVLCMGTVIAFDLVIGVKAIDDAVKQNEKLQEDMKLKYAEALGEESYADLTEKEQEAYDTLYAGTFEINVPTYKKQLGYFLTVTTGKSSYTDNYNEKIDKMCEIYNISYDGSVSGGVNTDGSEYKFDEKTNTYVSENGMLADGYIFSVDKAIDILLTIYETRQYYTWMGEDADEALADALADAKSSYNSYRNGLSEEDYAEGTRPPEDLNITVDKINGILSAILEQAGALLDSLSFAFTLPEEIADFLESDPDLEAVIAFVSYMLDIVPSVNSLDPTVVYDFGSSEVNRGSDSDGKLITKAEAQWLVEVDGTYEKLTPEDIMVTYNDEGEEQRAFVKWTSSTTYEVLQSEDVPAVNASNTILEALSGFGLTELTVDGVMDLVHSFMYYQSPQEDSIYEFIDTGDDEETELLKEYGYAMYYATKHGANIGSVLLGDNIGQITMDTQGYPSSFAYSQKDLYEIINMQTYVDTYYPLFLARKLLLVFGAWVALMTAATYHWKSKQNDVFEEITGGKL